MQYETGTHKDGYSSCPLCRVFGATRETLLEGKCNNCPNAAFENTEAEIPCVIRTVTYPALDWGTYPYSEEDEDVEFSENSEYLIKFWKRVLTLLPQGYKKEFVLTQQQKESILSIAKQLQDEWDKEHNFDH